MSQGLDTTGEGRCCSGFSAAIFVIAGCLVLAAALTVGYRHFYQPSLTIRTEPAGASVFVNGHLAGATPVSVTGLTSGGDYSVRLEKEGFRPLIKNFKLDSGGTKISESLQRRGHGSLKVDVQPAGSEVLLDGEFVGHTPMYQEKVPVGLYELQIRKTNFKPYVQRVEVTTEVPLEFKDFGLEDVILAMLRGQVDRERQRVSHYMDLGHYLFVNNKLDESAEVYAKALAVANTPLEFPQEADAEERRLEVRLRAEDLNRLNDEIRKKSHWPGKDVAKWARILKQQQEVVAGNNITEWATVREQAQNFVRDNNFERAQKLLQDHIAAVKDNNPLLAQAHIELLSLRLRMRNLDGAKETFTRFSELYGNQPAVARQAANAIYSANANYQGEQRAEILSMAEKLWRKSVGLTQRGRGDPELHALCKFELANVLTLQGRNDQAVEFYKDAIAGTRDASTKELRGQRLVDCYKALGNFAEARSILLSMINSPRPDIATRAKADLQQLDLLEKSISKQQQKAEPSPELK
jgi:tetratricopeptide (TPR) repeat protein